jgi:transcriptional regulator GlxA family with amidase domain
MKMTLANSYAQRVISAIHTLRDRFAEPVRIEELALVAQMSPSAFHRHFKAMTSMTPLQYQKRLRLLEARRLIVTDATNVETTAFQSATNARRSLAASILECTERRPGVTFPP